jgi:peroxiredoxin Q/BCP
MALPKTGDAAPDFCLPNNLKSETCLKDLRGKWVVLYFYPKDNTPGCTMEAIYFSKAMEEFKALGTEILGVSADSVESHCGFAEKHDLAITLLSDVDRQVLEKYGVWTKKSMYGKSFLGISRTTFIIDPKGKIAHVWPKVKVAGHGDDVKAVLKKLQGA